jgi:hypothetical protein
VVRVDRGDSLRFDCCGAVGAGCGAVVRQMKCKRCNAEIADDREKTLAAARWGWAMAPDPGLGQDAYGDIPGWWYACADCSDDGYQDAFAYARKGLHQ